MKEYRNELRYHAAMLVHKRAPTRSELEAPVDSPLDAAITDVARRYKLRGRALQTFGWLYRCHSVEEIQVLLLETLDAEVDAESVERYARDAKKRLIDAMLNF